MISIFSWIAPPLSLSFSFSNPPSSLLSILVRTHRLLHLVECILSLFPPPPPLSLSGIISSISVLPPWWRCVVTWHERLSFIGRWPHVVVEANDPSKSGRLWNNYFAFVFLFFFLFYLIFLFKLGIQCYYTPAASTCRSQIDNDSYWHANVKRVLFGGVYIRFNGLIAHFT